MSELANIAKYMERTELKHAIHKLNEHIYAHYERIDELEARRQRYIRQLNVPFSKKLLAIV